MKKKTLITSAIASLTIAPVLSLATTSCSKVKLSESHIIAINDLHGAAPGYGDTVLEVNKANAGAIRLAQEFEDIKTQYPGSFVISAGDLNAGDSFSTCEKGETLYPVLKCMDIRYSTLGNHAWEWGVEPLKTWHFDKVARTKDTIGNYFFTSNVLNSNEFRNKTWCKDPDSFAFAFDYKLWKDNLLPWADPFKIVDMNGHNVCLIGLTTNSTLNDGNMEAMKSLSFIDYSAAVMYSKAYAYEILGSEKYEAIEAFILDTHLGSDWVDGKDHSKGIQGEAVVLAQEIPTRVDAIISAHTHKVCGGLVHNTTLNKDIPVYQAGQQGRNYLDIALTFNDAKSDGERLKDIKIEIKTPQIPTEKADATQQLKDIVANTKYDSVKETAKVYLEQRDKAWKNLSTEVGTVKKVVFDTTKEKFDGLPYWYRDAATGCGTSFLQSPTLLEPAGIWANLAMIKSFNEHYKTYISENKCYKPCVSITNIDSLAKGFNIDTAGTDLKLIKNNIYQMHPYENQVHYGCLTVNQLKEYINYILAGAENAQGFELSNRPAYSGVLHKDGKGGSDLIEWNDDELVNVTKGTPSKGVATLPGLVQFFGLSFAVKKGTQHGDFYEYSLDETDTNHPLRIYDPNNSACLVEDPNTWILASEWATKAPQYKGYVPMIMADFTWQGGNGQNRMLHHWFDYNATKDALAGHQGFDMYTRATALEYIQMLEAGKEVNWLAGTKYIDDTYVSDTLTINN